MSEELVESQALEGLNDGLKPSVIQYIEKELPEGVTPTLTLLFHNGNGRVIRVQAGDKDFVLKIGISNKAEDLKVVPSAISSQVMKEYRHSHQSFPDMKLILGISQQPYYDGKNYEDVLKEDTLSPYQKFYTALEWVFALENLHLRGIIHTDLKPQNMLKLENDQAILIDYDTAQLCGEDEVITRKTRDLGTEPYLAPESILDRQYSQRSDIYALCVMLVRDLKLIPGAIDPPKIKEQNNLEHRLWLGWTFEEKENLNGDWSRLILHGGLKTLEERPTLQMIQGAILRIAKAELKDEESYKKLERHYAQHKQLQAFMDLYANKAKEPGAKAQLKLHFDNTFNQKCEILGRHAAKPALGLSFFKGNRTYQCLQVINWIDHKGKATETAPAAFRDAYENATNPAATAADAPPAGVNANEIQLAPLLFRN